MVFNENGEEIFSFGKHKGRLVEEIFAIEPSYYSWMKQGDFPLYTKKCLDRVWARFKAKQKEQRTAVPKAASATRPQPSTGPNRPESNRNNPQPKRKSGPITDDMLKNLQEKFKK